MGESRRIGYARVSKTEQETALQLAALNVQHCDLIFEEKIKSVAKHRPAFEECIRQLQPGDTLIVWKLDRLGRNTVQLITLIDDLEKRGIHFNCITQGFDTSTPIGKAFLGMMAVFAQLERDQIIERTTAGLLAAEEKGHFGGRPRKLTPEQVERAKEAYVNRPLSLKTGKRMTMDELAAEFGVNRRTLDVAILHDGIHTQKGIRPLQLRAQAKREAFAARQAS